MQIHNNNNNNHNNNNCTETAVLKVYNDLLLAADSGQVSVLCMLDLMAAFNTVNHDLLMHVLSVCLVSVVLSSSGSVHICLTGPLELFLELFLAATVHSWFTCFAPYRKVQF